jgi:hypothetical protein
MPLVRSLGATQQAKIAPPRTASDRARRHTQAELEQLACDPRVAPTGILAGEAQHDLSDSIFGRRTAQGLPRLRHFRRMSSRCQRSSACGVTTSPWRRLGGQGKKSERFGLGRLRSLAHCTTICYSRARMKREVHKLPPSRY